MYLTRVRCVSHYVIVLSLSAIMAGVRQLFWGGGFDCLLDQFQNFWQV